MMALINQNKIIIKPLHYIIIKIKINKLKHSHISKFKKYNLNNKIKNSHYIIQASFNNKVKNNLKHHSSTPKSTNLKLKNHLEVNNMISQDRINIRPHNYIKMILNKLLQLIKLLNIQIAFKNNLTKLLLFIQMTCNIHLSNSPNKDFKLLNYIQINNNLFKLNNNNSKLHLFIRMIIDRHPYNQIHISHHNNINKI